MIHKGCIKGCTKSDRKAPAGSCSSYGATVKQSGYLHDEIHTPEEPGEKNKGLWLSHSNYLFR